MKQLLLLLFIRLSTFGADSYVPPYIVTAKGIYIPTSMEGISIDSSFWNQETEFVDNFQMKLYGVYQVLYHPSGLQLYYSDSSMSRFMKISSYYLKPILHGTNQNRYQVEQFSFGKMDSEPRAQGDKHFIEAQKVESLERKRMREMKGYRKRDTLIHINETNSLFAKVGVNKKEKSLLRKDGGTLHLTGRHYTATKVTDDTTLFTTINGAAIEKAIKFNEWQLYSKRDKWRLLTDIDKECKKWRSPLVSWGWPEAMPTATNSGPATLEISGFYGWVKRSSDFYYLGPSLSIEGGDGYVGNGVGVALFSGEPGHPLGALHLRYSTQHIGHSYADILEDSYRGPEVVLDTWLFRLRAARLYTAGRKDSFNRFSLGFSFVNFFVRWDETVGSWKFMG